MRESIGPLPEFDRPPVSEVAMSVQFNPIANWRSTYGGLYWSHIEKEYPSTEEHPPLSPQVEKFGEEFLQPRATVRLEVVEPGNNRFWFLAEPPTRLIQIQRDRFVVNWRKVRGDEKYPRYRIEIRSRFEREWKRFREFLAEQRLGNTEVQQCEITYVNDIPQGEGWQTFSEALTLFAPWWGSGTDGYLPSPEMLTVSGSFLMPSSQGRLHFATQHARRRIDNREVIQLRLVARGMPESSADDHVMKWMDLGHDWIVRAFADLTSARAHDLWGRRRP